MRRNRKYKFLLKYVKAIMLLFGFVLLYKKFIYANSDADEFINPYFFAQGKNSVEYRGFFHPLSYRKIWQNIDLHINQIGNTENGILYSMVLDQLNVRDTLDEIRYGERCLGYFYVTEDAIYHMAGVNMPVGDENSDEVTKMLQENEATFIENCTVVCSEEGTENIVDENGYHEYVEVDDDRRIFHLYNDYISGTKQYTCMIWEREKGLVYYRMGSGNMVMHIELWQEDVGIYGVDSKRMADMTVVENLYTSYDKHIFYPEIYGFDNRSKEIAINSCIKNELEHFMKNDSFYISMDYEIKVLNNKFIVIFYSGTYWKEEEKRMSISLATTIDVENEKTDSYIYNSGR